MRAGRLENNIFGELPDIEQGVSPLLICSFNLMQGKKGKETLYKAERVESLHLLCDDKAV